MTKSRELNDATIRAARAHKKPYKLNDGRGLTLHVTPTGSKLWRLRYWRDGKESMCSLGKFDDVLLAEARKKAQEARAHVEAGRNPSQQRKIEKTKNIEASANTFKALAEAWIAEETWTPKYRKRVIREFTKHAYPVLGDRPIVDIGAGDILAAARKKAKHGPHAGKQFQMRLGGVFRYAVRNGVLRDDPTLAIRQAIKTPEHQHKALLDIPAYLRAARSLAGPDHAPLLGAALELLLLLACRPGELRNMKWEQIDTEAATWTVPDTGMKAKRPHIWPLSEAALAVLKRIPRVNGYVFASPRLKGKQIGDEALRKAMREANLRGSPHSVRASFSTWAHGAGKYPSHVIEFALAHADRDATRASYNMATYLSERRALADAWAQYVSKQ